MASKNNILRVLDYICKDSTKQVFDSDQISEALKLSVSEVNTASRELEYNGDVKISGGYKELHNRGAISIVKTTATVDAFNTGKYESKLTLKNIHTGEVLEPSVEFYTWNKNPGKYVNYEVVEWPELVMHQEIRSGRKVDLYPLGKDHSIRIIRRDPHKNANRKLSKKELKKITSTAGPRLSSGKRLRRIVNWLDNHPLYKLATIVAVMVTIIMFLIGVFG
ncbi:MAG: hypothetical protein DHS20C17_28290 [Cyclobacteriaceae bacterium]|nr:MAG: hypothetical protein DHS20C17_28290 [Cyclobacteriaceae bacterium]